MIYRLHQQYQLRLLPPNRKQQQLTQIALKHDLKQSVKPKPKRLLEHKQRQKPKLSKMPR